MMIARCGDYLINLAAIVAVRFFTSTLDVQKEPTEHCTVWLANVPEVHLDEAATKDLRMAFGELERAMRQQSMAAVPVGLPNIRQKGQ